MGSSHFHTSQVPFTVRGERLGTFMVTTFFFQLKVLYFYSQKSLLNSSQLAMEGSPGELEEDRHKKKIS